VFPPLFFEIAVMPPARPTSPDCLIVRVPQAAPAFENWQAESVLERALGKGAARTCQGPKAPEKHYFPARRASIVSRDIRPAEPRNGANTGRRRHMGFGAVAADDVDSDDESCVRAMLG
jgi:hypothetical protein